MLLPPHSDFTPITDMTHSLCHTPLRRRLLVGLAASVFASSALLLPIGDGHASETAGDRILIGNSSALTGPLAPLSMEYVDGAKLYFDTVNRRGGINGKRLELVVLDDEYSPDKAEENARRLINEHGVFALFACFGTGPALRAMPVALAADVPFFAPYTGADALREPPNANVFHLRASYSREIERIVEHLTMLGVKSIGVVHHADAFGEAGLQAARAALALRGLEPAVTAAIDMTANDASEPARLVAEANPAALILVAAGRTPPMMIRALRETTAQPMLYGLSVISSSELVRTLGRDAHGLALAQVTPSPFRLDYPVVRDYRRDADSAGMEYSYAGLEGYLAAAVFSEALRQAGSNPTRDAFRQALAGMANTDIGGLKLVGTTANPVGLDFIDLTVISHGRFGR